MFAPNAVQTYSSQQKALKCDESHKKIVKIVNQQFKVNGTVPAKIAVQDETGVAHWYYYSKPCLQSDLEV